MVRLNPEDHGVGQIGDGKPQISCHILVTSSSKDRAFLTPILCLQTANPISRLYMESEVTTSQTVILVEEVSTVFWKT